MTKLYLHRGTSGLPSGTLPTAEQSTLTSGNDFEANQATNRLMNNIAPSGSSTTLINTSTGSTSLVNYYVARWVSPVIYNTDIEAQTWNYQFRTEEGNAQANFPVNGTNQPVYVNCYVWKPSNGTKVGTILDGNTASQANEGTPITNTVTFSGSAVSSLTGGDAIIVFEAWFRVTQGMTSAYSQTFTYDGNIAGADDSFIETPQTISFTEGGEPVDCTVTGKTITTNRITKI